MTAGKECSMKDPILTVTHDAQICAQAVDELSMRSLARASLGFARRFLDRPGERERFERWLAARQAEGKYLDKEVSA